MELDPRYLIARATDFADHDVSNGLHAVNLELASGNDRSRRDRLLDLRACLGDAGHIDDAHLDAPAGLTVATAEVTAVGLQKLEQLAQRPANAPDGILRRFEYAQILKPPRIRPVPGLTLPNGIAVGRATPSKPKPGVIRDVFAVIDHGCPFTHPLLCTQSGAARRTRMRALWDQQPAATSDVRTKPKGFEYGAELSRAQLNAVIRAAAGDERLAYESLGYEALRMRESHGAHALGMLLDDGVRPRGRTRRGRRPDVLFVQLPQGLLSAPNRAVLTRHVVDALVWIESQRQEDERVILSLSEGSSQGPNDGSSIVERALQAFTQWGPRDAKGLDPDGRHLNRIYIAAGNGFEERLHAQAMLTPSAPTSFLWRVPPASELPASVEIWLPTGANDAMAEVQVEVFTPDGRLAACVTPKDPIAHWPDAPAAVVSVASTAWRGDGCTLCLVRLAPTAASGNRACAPVGDWTIKLTTTIGMKEPVHLFIGRIKRALGFPLRTVQSTFVFNGQPGFVGASGQGTLQGLATAEGVIRVGGVVGVRDQPPARYSSHGPSRNRSIRGPDISVKVDDGQVLKGRRSTGNRSGVSFRMDGTSVGAPLAANIDRSRPRPPRDRTEPNPPPKPPKDAEAKGEILPDPFEA
jgi:hypothetical protein